MHGRDFRGLPAYETIPSASEDLFFLSADTGPLNDPQWAVGDIRYFPSRRGRPMRRVIRIDAVISNSLSTLPDQQNVASGASLQQCTITLRAINGEYLVKNMPLLALLPSFNSGDENFMFRPKWWDHLPVDWETSYITNCGPGQFEDEAVTIHVYYADR